jgi:hypothetical protein
MCIFTSSVESVAATKIFARAEGTRQILVYEMTVRRGHQAAMILPLPIPPGGPENAVKFINLQDSMGFFSILEKWFYPPPKPRQNKGGFLFGIGDEPRLPVESVGMYEASYVPRLQDFERLDPRFRLPPQVWANLPLYADYGFVVFKLDFPLRPGDMEIDAARARIGLRPQRQPAMTVHPMAFSFPRRDPSALFFPTVHVHDLSVQPQADFDHALYAQLRRDSDPAALSASRHPWLPPPENAQPKLDPTLSAARVLAPNQPVVRLGLRGKLDNADTLLFDP